MVTYGLWKICVHGLGTSDPRMGSCDQGGIVAVRRRKIQKHPGLTQQGLIVRCATHVGPTSNLGRALRTAATVVLAKEDVARYG